MPRLSRKQSQLRKKRKQTKRKQRRQRRQTGGGFAFDIPPNAIVEHRSMDDEGTNPPTFMTKRAMDEMVSESERA